MEQLMIVFSNPRPGREEEFDAWYHYVHIHDVMVNCPGARWVQRYRSADRQPPGAEPRYRYLAVYAGDHGGFTAGHRAHIFTDAMPISTAFDVEDHRAAYYEVQAGDEASGVMTSWLLVERHGAGVAAVEKFSEHRAAATVLGGLVATTAEHQLFPQHADTVAVSLYSAVGTPEWALDPGTERGLYTPISGALTVEDARAPSPQVRERAAQVRAAMNRMVPPPRS